MMIRGIVIETVTAGITKKELIPDVLSKHEDTLPEKHIIPPEPFENAKIPEYKASALMENRTINAAASPVQEDLFGDGFLSPQSRPLHRIIGQVFDTYWLIEYERKLYIIDQHAAHEKVLYERISAQIRKGAVMSQLVSPPYIVTLTGAETDVVNGYIDIFAQTRFTIEHFGGREYALSAVPVELFRLGEIEFFKSMLDEMAEDPRNTAPAQIRDRIATMACKAAVKGNMKMSTAEADALIDELLLLDNPYNCPHGRPTVITFSRSDLEKLFKRIV